MAPILLLIDSKAAAAFCESLHCSYSSSSFAAACSSSLNDHGTAAPPFDNNQLMPPPPRPAPRTAELSQQRTSIIRQPVALGPLPRGADPSQQRTSILRQPLPNLAPPRTSQQPTATARPPPSLSPAFDFRRYSGPVPDIPWVDGGLVTPARRVQRPQQPISPPRRQQQPNLVFHEDFHEVRYPPNSHARSRPSSASPRTSRGNTPAESLHRQQRSIGPTPRIEEPASPSQRSLGPTPPLNEIGSPDLFHPPTPPTINIFQDENDSEDVPNAGTQTSPPIFSDAEEVEEGENRREGGEDASPSVQRGVRRRRAPPGELPTGEQGASPRTMLVAEITTLAGELDPTPRTSLQAPQNVPPQTAPAQTSRRVSPRSTSSQTSQSTPPRKIKAPPRSTPPGPPPPTRDPAYNPAPRRRLSRLR